MDLVKQVQCFLEQRIESFYVEVLPSRWSNVMQKLCQTTQQLKLASLLTHPSVEMGWSAAFAAATTLVEEEHRIIQEGSTLCKALESSHLAIEASSLSLAASHKEEGKRKVDCKQNPTAACKNKRENSSSSILVVNPSSVDISPFTHSHSISSLTDTSGGVLKGMKEFHLFLSGMLTQVALKESILAEWCIQKEEMTDDTLRVYAHACIASFALVTRQATDRLKLLFCP